MYDWTKILKRRRSRRWDSSDPERAPPPLPLNPRSMSPATKNNVSPNIQAVAAKFQDRSSENALSSYTTNPMPPKSGSPERSLVKGHYHKRMQSLQPSDTKGDARSEFLNYLESRSPERPLRATIVDPTTKPQDSSKGPESPPARAAEREIPSYVSSRYLSKPLFGESTPPSATMLALQNMQLPIDNDPPSPSKPPKMLPAPKSEDRAHTMDTLASQIHSLTDIASNLQREMSNLSRRSKDNATDLVSLKAATNARDEDIRKSLKDLSSSLTSKYLDGEFSRFDLGAFLKPENGPNPTESDSSPNSKRSYSVPRMPSPNPFAFDRDICGSPAPISDGSASIALLEKVLREMATKEGEERLLELVDEIKSRPAATPSDKDADTKITNMLEEILNLVKEDPSSKALVRSMTTQNLRPPDSANVEGTRSASLGSIDGSATVRALNVPSSNNQLQRASASGDEVLTILRSVKNSVVESGGMTNGVKALVRELRGEVLGMGRDLARKLETVESNIVSDAEPKDQSQPLSADEISAIINESLRDLQEQLAATVNESRNHSTALSEFQSTMNSAEIYSIVKKALDEIEFPQPQQESQGSQMEKDDILDTVREAWETYKPEIELQTIGLERDEILECLAEGLKSYQPQHQQAITYEEVLAAVQTGMQNFTPPPVEHSPTITRDEIILTIRECLEKPESASRGLDQEHVTHLNSMRDDILHAVSEKLQPQSRGLDEEHVSHLYSMRDEILHGLSQIAQSQPRGLDEDQVNYLNNIRDQILHAVTERQEPSQRSLDDEHIHYLNSVRDDILHAVTERSQFAAPRTLDDEQFEHMNNLRDEILDAVTRSIATQSVVSKESFDSGLGRDDIVSAISDGLEAHFTTAKEMDDSRVSREDVVNAINDAFNAQQSALTPANPPSISREEIMDAIAEGIEIANQTKETALSADVHSQSLSADEIFEAISEGLHRYHESEKSALSTEVQQPVLTREEVFNAIVDGFESANTMTREIELNKEDLMEAITAGLQEATSAANLNVGDQVLERLQEVIGGMKEELKQYSAPNSQDTEQVLETIKDELAVVRQEIESYVATAQDVSGRHEIIDTVKDGFRLLQADMEKTITDTAVSHAPRSNPDTPELLDAMEKEFEHLRGTISNLLTDNHRTGSEKDEILDAIREVGEQHKSNSGDAQILSSIKEEFEAMRERMEMSVVRAEPPSSDKEDIIAALRESLDALREETIQLKSQPGDEQLLNSIKEHLESMRERTEMSVVRSEPESTDKEDIIAALRESIDALREETMQLNAQPGEEQILNSIKEQFESMHERMETSVVRSEPPPSEKEDIVAALQDNFDALHAQLSAQPAEEQIINSIKEQFEAIRERMETSLVHSEPPASEKEDIVAALQENFDALHAHFSAQPAEEQILSSMKEQFDGMRELVEMSLIRSEKEEIVTALQENFDALHAQLSAQPTEEIINSVKEQLEVIRERMETIAVPAEPVSEKDDIVAALQENFDALHAQLGAQPAEEQIINSIKEQFDALRERMEMSVVPAEPPASEKEDILAALQVNFDALQAQLGAQPAEEQILNSMKEQFDAMRELMATSLVAAEPISEKEDIVAALQENFDALHAQLGAQPAEEQIINSITEQFEAIRERMEMSVVPAEPVSEKEDIVAALQPNFDTLHAKLSAQPGEEQILNSMKQHFESLRERMEMSMVPVEPPASNKEDVITALREHFDGLKEQAAQQNSQPGIEQVLDSMKEHFETMRERMEMSVVRAEPPSDKEDIIDALRGHFDSLRAETIQHNKDGTENMLSNTSEILVAFNGGIESIREDVQKVLDKPAEFDASEILETVKDGFAELRLELESLRQPEEEEATREIDDAETTRGGEMVLASESTLGPDIEGLKSLITQLTDKVDAIDSASPTEEQSEVSEPAEGALNRGHLDEIMVALQEVQLAMGEMSANKELPEGVARKEDTDALENLILSTKAQLDEINFPAPEELASAEQIAALETMVREAKDAIAEFSARLEAEGSTKADIGTLEGLIKDVWISVDELKGKSQDGEETEEGDEGDDNGKLLKSDLQTVEAMIFEVKTQIDELKLPDVESLPTKDEINELSSLVTDFRDKMESANDLTAQGFEARKIEHGGLAEKIDEKIDEAKYVVGELGEELKSKLDGSSEGLNELKQLLEGLAVSAESFTTVENVKELTDLINREFERARGEDDATKLDNEERDAAALVKHDETRAAIINEIGTKIDEKIGEILSKYDDAHNSLHSKFSETEERDMAHAEMVTSTKSLAEDIKLVIGSMGTTVTETCERMAEDTKALAEKVGESYTRMEEMHNEAKSHQEQSRGENERAVAATERVESKLLEFHPQILQTVQEILTVVSDHYDHSQKSTEEVKLELSALPSTIPTMLPALPPPESSREIEDDPVHNKLNDLLEHAKNNPIQEVLNTLVEHSKNDQLHSKLDRVLEASAASNSDIYEKLNLILDQATSGSGSVHEKLDALLERPVNAVDPDQTVTQMMKLDEMHKDIMENTRKMNEMFAAQSILVAEDTERKRREAEEVAIALERRVAQREQVESEIVGLHEEKDSLLKMLHTLKTEKDELTKQNAKMSKELSGLETALEIRHEEMQQMEERADGLEKRILEGVLDHARSVLLSRSGSISTMNLKRNRSVRTSRTGARSPSMMSTTTVSTAREPKDARSLLGNGVGMALKRRTVHGHQPATTAVQPNIGKERRILSLSHVTGNRDAGRQIGPNTGMPSLKRSHSVKSNFSLRKASWAGPKSTSNKENEAFHEEDELQSDVESDAGTERNTSYAGTDRRSSYAGTERKASYAETCTDSVVTGVTESVISEDRRTSGMSGTSDGRTEYVESSIADDDHDQESDHEGSEASSQSGDDTETARENDDGDDATTEGGEKEENGDDQFSDTASAVEAEGMKLLEAPPDGGLGTEMTVS
ncbi:uncharacterized protein N7483_001922 [Penicillium malachiteum]|uniref:uncharacterized protein n=1 Tax=Penicillium malachiteum TaxID=1324776 RepID=UPI002547F603|nr:uncharacterized protein N7483_001922 [Penicillium malachiteum]KAJ5736797.1 hypothetical protein N7483_001922 [Penicillium malachiteum]